MTAGRKVSTLMHVRTLLWKNWLLKKRHPIATFFEVVLPVLFIILMSGLKGLTDNVNVPAGWSDGESFTLTNYIGDFGTWNLNLKLGGFSNQRKYMASETTLSGLLMYLGLRAASELRNVDTLSSAQLNACRYAVGYFGKVSTDAASPNAIPSECRNVVTPYKLGIAPDNDFTRKYFYETMKQWYPIVEASKSKVNATSRVKVPAFEDSVKFFDNNAALESYIKSMDYGQSVDTPKIYGAIVFEKHPVDNAIGTFGDIEYSLRFNSTQGKGGSVGDVPRTVGDPPFESPFQKTIVTDYFQRYASLGFMTLQTAVTRFANCLPAWDASTKTTTGVCSQPKAVAKASVALDTQMYQRFATDFMFKIVHPKLFQDPYSEMMGVDASEKEKLLVPLRVAPQSYYGLEVSAFPIHGFLSAPFYDSVKDVFALVFILAYLYSVSRILVVFIQEKETRAREYMKILGIAENSIIFAWYITYITIFLIGSILQAIASKGGLFSASDPGIIFLFFFLFSMSVLSFGFLVSTLFSRARTGAFAGMVLFFFMYFVSSAFSSSSSKGSKGIACLLSPVALAFGVQTLASVESTNEGINHGNIRTISDNFSFDISLGMLFFDTILYTVLGLYFERVVPKEWGTTEKWYFPVQPSYWRRKFSSRKVNDMANYVDHAVDVNSNVEPVGPELLAQERSGEALVIKNIKKEFVVPGGVKKAVRGVSLSMYKDQITCLLGHNGAGKTTLISMLTGVIAPTEGDAYFRGLSLRNNMAEIRQSLGLCFQYDVLYAEMTVEEHLLFFARVKGYRGKELNEVVTTKIQEVGLTEKRKVNSASLSGGMKRKLSVAICLLGDSALVFLDEPTSGMDPYSRRSTWEILLNNRQNRVVVLTTHFMDEADILGDRIAIMAEGQLRCCGSSLFLKNKYGAGYNFTLVKADQCREQELIALISHHVPRATILSNVGAEISFQLPLDSSTQFPTMFEELDNQLTALGVLSYGISVTTMEEVFIKVAEAGDEDQQHTLKKDVGAAAVAVAVDKPSGPAIANLTGIVMFVVHLTALLTKRFRVAKRDRRVLVFSALLPVVLLAAGLGLLKSSSLTRPDLKIPLTSDKFLAGSNMEVPYFCEKDDAQWCSYPLGTLFDGGKTSAFTSSDIATPPYPTATPTVFGVDYPVTEFDVNGTTGVCLRLGEKAYQRAFGYVDGDLTHIVKTPVKNQYGAFVVHGSGADQVFAYHAMVNTTTTHGSIIFKALLDEALYRWMASDADATKAKPSVNLTVNAFPLPYTATTKALFGSFLSFTACIFIVIAFAFFPASIVVFLVKEKQPEHNSKHQQLVSGVSLPAFWLSNYIWDLVMYSVPFVAAIVLIKLFDIAALTGNGCTVCTSATYPAVVLLFVLFGFAICPFTYVMSYLFKDHANSQTYTIMANFILGVVLMVVSFILDVIESSKAANKVLKFFWRLSPLYSLGTGLLNQAMAEIKANFGLSKSKPSPFDLDIMGWEMLYLALDAVVFFAVAVGIDFLLSFPKIRAAIFKDPAIQDPPFEEDEDVVKEAERVRSGAADGDAVLVKNLRKVYKGNKVAVRNLSFGLPKGECFGYLGINGAGKTTTMKMLTGDYLPTSGIGKLGGFDILTQQLEVRRQIGYCPQFDALFELLSVREHLELFARIKGIPRSELNKEVKELMHQMNLDDFEHKLAGTLSGGNKRKLSVAIAMIGSPPIIFLDEPSTGMDPVSRRFMWNVIAAISTHKKESTIILTTHSMEECEALCTRVGIMVGGRLRCLGSVQHLKNRHGHGLMVELKLDQAHSSEVEARAVAVFGNSSADALTQDQITDACGKMGDASWASKIDAKHSTGYALAAALTKDGSLRKALFVAWWMAEERFLGLHTFLEQCFGAGHAQLLERQNDLCRYKLLGDAKTLKLSNVFRLVEGGKAAHHIREYSVSQTTLEQIFNYFASQQSEEKGVARGMGG